MIDKAKVQAQFSQQPDAYRTSKVHAAGASLRRLQALITPAADWRILDVAAGAGHAGFQFAPAVGQLVVTDLTPAMLRVAQRRAAELNLPTTLYSCADAEALPFATGSFDLLLCRIAVHHFPQPARFIAEAKRLLRPGGLLAIVDNIVPGSLTKPGRKKRRKDRLQDAAGDYINAFEKLRDPGHQACLSRAGWRQQLLDAGLALQNEELLQKEIDFDEWCARMNVGADRQIRLQVMLRQAPAESAAFLTPRQSGNKMKFHLTEAIFIARKEN